MSEKAMKMLATALDMEEKGKNFYEEAAQNCSNDMGRQIFAMLKKDEIVHMERIKAIYGSLDAGRGWTKDWQKYDISHKPMEEFFTELADKQARNIRADSSDTEALEVGVNLEQKAIKYYKERLEEADEAPEKNFLEKMIKEEHSHFKALNDAKDLLTDPEAWFMMKERHLPSGP